jgi:hypothetical protein
VLLLKLLFYFILYFVLYFVYYFIFHFIFYFFNSHIRKKKKKNLKKKNERMEKGAFHLLLLCQPLVLTLQNIKRNKNNFPFSLANKKINKSNKKPSFKLIEKMLSIHTKECLNRKIHSKQKNV